MRSSLFAATAILVVTAGLGAQAPVKMPAGDYTIRARDASKSDSVGMVGWPFKLQGNGNFSIMTMPDSLLLTGKLVPQKDGTVLFSEQTCSDGAGTYTIVKEGDGYAFNAKSDPCVGRDKEWVKLLFVPGKAKS